MNYEVVIRNSAKGDLKKLKKSLLKQQFLQVVAALKEDPYQPTQSFEKLQPASQKFYSRRINSQHRAIYRVDDQNKIVTIYAAWTHYE